MLGQILCLYQGNKVFWELCPIMDCKKAYWGVYIYIYALNQGFY